MPKKLVVIVKMTMPIAKHNSIIVAINAFLFSAYFHSINALNNSEIIKKIIIINHVWKYQGIPTSILLAVYKKTKSR